MKRTELKDNFVKAEAKIEQLRNEKEALSTQFRTGGKFIDKFGFVSELPTAKELVKAKTLVDSKFEKFTDKAKELGLEDEMSEDEATFMGLTKDIWDADFMLRVQQLKLETKINKLTVARKIFKKHLSEDDKFAIDMAKMSDATDLLAD